jgi:DNA-directed RNA polymerase specialized sigma24 family protein
VAGQRWGEDLLSELRRLYEPTRRFAAIVGRFDAEPDDLVQEAYTRVLLVEPGRINDLGPYLRRIVVNLANNERRRAKRGVLAVSRLADRGGGRDAYPSELADLMHLEPRVRALLYLVDVEGERIAAAADAVGMAPPAARMALTRARRRLKVELQEEHEELDR